MDHHAPSKRRVPKWIRKYFIELIGTRIGFFNEAKAFDPNKIIIDNLHLKKNKIDQKDELCMRKLEKTSQNLDLNCEVLLDKLKNSFDPAQVKSKRMRVRLINEIIKCQTNLLKDNKVSKGKIPNSFYIENEIKENKIYTEWKILSKIVDRLCFFIYLFLFLASSFLFFLSGTFS